MNERQAQLRSMRAVRAGIEVRAYQEEDCAGLVQLFCDTVHAINAADYTSEQLRVWVGSVDMQRWNASFLEHITEIALCNGMIVGFADMDKKGYIDRLYVHKDYQKSGVATALFAVLHEEAMRRGVSVMETYASLTAAPFFTKMGFETVNENMVWREGVALKNIRMRRNV